MTIPATPREPDMVDINIDEAAPVKAQREIHIDAPPESVWATLTAIDRWPEWNPDVREAVLDGPLAPGSTFRWKAGPGTVRLPRTRMQRSLDTAIEPAPHALKRAVEAAPDSPEPAT